MTLTLLVVGFISVGAADSAGGNYTQASMMLVWLLVYYLTVGPICYAIISESLSTRLRNKSVCLSRRAGASPGCLQHTLAAGMQLVPQVISPVVQQLLVPTQHSPPG